MARFRFGDYSLDSEAYRLSGGGLPVRIEPRILEFLVLLIRERGRVVSKEELFEQLWSDQFVSESALTRCVYLARQALRDDSDAQSFIKTVHGRGYQFVAEVSEEAAEAPSVAADTPRQPLEGLTERPGRRAWSGGAIVTALVLVAAIAYLTRPWGPRPRSDQEAPGTVVIGFENLSDPGDPENLGRILSGLITTDLAESGGLEVASTAKVLTALKRAGVSEPEHFDVGAATEAAVWANARLMLVGQLNRTTGGLVLAAELVEVGSGNTLGSLTREAASGEDLFSLAGAIAEEVRTKLGVAERRAPQVFDLAHALTSSTTAYGH